MFSWANQTCPQEGVHGTKPLLHSSRAADDSSQASRLPQPGRPAARASRGHACPFPSRPSLEPDPPAPPRGAEGLGPRKGEAAGLARGPGLRAPRGRAQATPGARRRLGRLRPPRRPSENSPAARGGHSLGHGGGGGRAGWTEESRRSANARRARPRLNLSPARLPRPRPRLSSAGQSQGRGGAT